MSPREASSLANPSSFFFSPSWNLRFSRNMTSPGFIALTFFLTSSPVQESSFSMSLCMNLDNLFATLSVLKRSTFLPFGLPIWRRRTTFAFLVKRFCMVGMHVTTLLSSTRFPSLSTETSIPPRTITVFPSTSTSSKFKKSIISQRYDKV